MQGAGAKPTEVKNLFTISKIEPLGIYPMGENRYFKERPKRMSTLQPPLRKNGGGDRDRTDDLLLAKQMLSQLSYAPENGGPG